jgi:hypothetical protein
MLIKLDVVNLTVTTFFASLDFVYKTNAIHILHFDRKVDRKLSLNFSTEQKFSFLKNRKFLHGKMKSRPVAGPWTQWLQHLPVKVHIRTYVYVCIYCSAIHALCVCVRVYIYIYIYILCIHNRKKLLSGPQNRYFNYTIRSVTLHKTSAYTHISDHQFCPNTAVLQMQHVDTVGCGRLCSVLICMFVFGILQIASGCVRICRGWEIFKAEIYRKA